MTLSMFRRPAAWVVSAAVVLLLTGFVPELCTAESRTTSSQPNLNVPANTPPAATGGTTAASSAQLDAILKKYGGKSPQGGDSSTQRETGADAAAEVARDAGDLTKTMSAVKQQVQSQKVVRQKSSGSPTARQRSSEGSDRAIVDEESSYSSTRSTGQPLGRMPNAVPAALAVPVRSSVAPTAARSSTKAVGQTVKPIWGK